MSDYEDDFENDQDGFNDRTKGKPRKSPSKNPPQKLNIKNNAVKESGYNTFERDTALALAKPKNPLTARPNLVNATPSAIKAKNNILSDKEKPQKLSKIGGIHSSTPNLQASRKDDKKSLLGGDKIATSKQVLTSFGLTKKAEQNIIPSRAMTIEQAEKLIEETKVKMDQFKSEKSGAGSGSLDQMLEISIKENKFLQKTLINIQDVINKIFEKYDPVKAPMKSYPQTDRIKSPPKSVQMKYRTKEVENAQKALENMMIEYEKVSARMEIIKDPNFFSNLHSQLDSINREMKDLEKENKTLLTEQKKREIEMEKLLAQGAPDTMFQINDLQNKVTITKDQLRKEVAENEEVDALMTQVLEQEKVLREKEEKLKSIGQKYEVNFDNQVDEKKQIEAEKLQAKKETYGKHLAIAESATKVMKKKLKTMSKVNKNRLKELEEQKAQYEIDLQIKTEEVKKKNKEIAELMEKNADLQRVRNRNQNPFLGEEKNENGYDAVQKAIQEQDEKETNAAIVIQAWCRMILAIRFVRKLREERQRSQKVKREKKSKPNLKAREETSKIENTETPIKAQNTEKPSKRQRVVEETPIINKTEENQIKSKNEDQPIQKKSTINQNAQLKKRDSIEAPFYTNTPLSNTQQEIPEENDQREKLKKVTSKPTFAKKK